MSHAQQRSQNPGLILNMEVRHSNVWNFVVSKEGKHKVLLVPQVYVTDQRDKAKARS